MATKANDTLRHALAAFWRVECCGTKADQIERGAPLDYLDQRILKAIEAFNEAMTEKRIAA